MTDPSPWQDGTDPPQDGGSYRTDSPPPAAGLGRVLYLAGALTSVGLLVWLGWWGAQQIGQEPRDLPVVRAPEGVMREPPPAPGGAPVDHVGLALNAVIAGAGAAPLPEEIRLAPETPGLAPGDLLPPARRVPLPADLAGDPLGAAAPPADLAPAGDPGLPSAELAAPDPAAPDTPAPAALAPAAPDAGAPAQMAPAQMVQGPGTSDPGLRPRPRPATPPPPPPPVVAADDRRAPAPGTRLVHLGTFASAEEARTAWAGLGQRHGDLMRGKARLVMQVAPETGDAGFWRLRAEGFADLAQANRFCAALVEKGDDCIPVVAP